MLPILAVLHLLIICCHKTLGGWQFGNRYLLDMMPYLFFGLTLWKPKGEKFVQWNTVILVFGFAINLIGTVATYNHWIWRIRVVWRLSCVMAKLRGGCAVCCCVVRCVWIETKTWKTTQIVWKAEKRCIGMMELAIKNNANLKLHLKELFLWRKTSRKGEEHF